MLDAGNCAPSCDATEGPHEQQPVRRQYTLKGVEAEAIDLMRTAAQREGMKISAWVSHRLREAAEKSLAEESAIPRQGVVSDSAARDSEQATDTISLRLRIQELEREVQELGKVQRLLMTKLLEHL